jgi:hypothetical protein
MKRTLKWKVEECSYVCLTKFVCVIRHGSNILGGWVVAPAWCVAVNTKGLRQRRARNPCSLSAPWVKYGKLSCGNVFFSFHTRHLSMLHFVMSLITVRSLIHGESDEHDRRRVSEAQTVDI